MASRKKPQTPRFMVRSALRNLWMRSRERSAALKREGYCCQHCGRKQSKAQGREVRIEVHHTNGIDWDGLIDLVFERLLVSPEDLDVFCVPCHDGFHEQDKKK